MNEKPFEDNKNQLKFLTQDQKEAMARLQLSIRHKNLGVLTGEVGSGKSTLLRYIATSVSVEQYYPVYICISGMKPRDFYYEMLYHMGEQTPFLMTKTKRLFVESIRNWHKQKEKTLLLIVDEAHEIHHDMLLEFRIIMNHEMDKESLFPIILAGQPELRRTLKLKKFEALSQRVKMQYHLGGMSVEETKDYIHARLEGIDRPVFADSAIHKLHSWTMGMPRSVNLICANAYFDAKSKGAQVIEENHIIRVISDIEKQRGTKI